MRYKELTDEEKKKFLDDYANPEVFKLEPKVGAVAYGAVVGGKSIFVFVSGILTGLFYKPLGVVFDVGKDIKIVHLSESERELEWCKNNAVGYNKNIKATLSDGRRNMEIIRQACSDFNNDSLYPAFAYIRRLGKDWYMPAKNELNLIYKNKDTINKALEILRSKAGVTAKPLQGDYGSSSFSYDTYAWGQLFRRDGHQDEFKRNDHGTIRAVRALTI